VKSNVPTDFQIADDGVEEVRVRATVCDPAQGHVASKATVVACNTAGTWQMPQVSTGAPPLLLDDPLLQHGAQMLTVMGPP
jgi:hypothetical protein